MIMGVLIHSDFLERLKSKLFHGEVHSVFDKAINILDDEGHIYSLICRNLDKAPDSLILAENHLGRLGIFQGDPVTASTSVLSFGRVRVSFEAAESYELGHAKFPDETFKLRMNLERARKRVNKDNMIMVTPFYEMMEKMLEERRKRLLDALRDENHGEIIKRALEIMGLGQGLTPSGDDILLGLFSVILLENSPLKNLSSLPACIMDNSQGRSNVLSIWGLKRASRGKFRERISYFLNDMMNGKDIMESLESMLDIGHSSGRDIIRGILTGFELILEKEETHAN